MNNHSIRGAEGESWITKIGVSCTSAQVDNAAPAELVSRRWKQSRHCTLNGSAHFWLEAAGQRRPCDHPADLHALDGV